MVESNQYGNLPDHVSRDGSLVLQLDQSELLAVAPTDADFVGVLDSRTQASSSYFRGTRIDGESYERVSMRFGDRERIWIRVNDDGKTVNYQLVTSNSYATGRPQL